MSELNENLGGKVAVVTGATTGIGKEIARNLARMGAEVVLGVRSLARGEAARADILKTAPAAKVELLEVDMANLASVRRFAAGLRQRYPKLHILVNNAGVWATKREVTAEGHESTLATNVLGPHLLTGLLLEPLQAAAPSRVVNMVSELANNLDLTDLEWQRRSYDGFKAYAQSKQAFRMLTWSLAKKLEGSGVTANAVSPGFVKTEFNRNAHGFVPTMINLMMPLMAQTPAQGADTPTWAAASASLDGASGKFFAKRKEKECKFRDPAQLAELEKAVEALIEGKTSAAAPAPASASAELR